MRPYVTIVKCFTKFHILQGEIFSCLRPGNVQKNLTRAVRRKQSYIFFGQTTKSGNKCCNTLDNIVLNKFKKTSSLNVLKYLIRI